MEKSWLKPCFDPTGKYSVVKDYGITRLLLQQQDRHGAPEDDARLLQAAAQVREQGAHEHHGRRRGGRPARADGASAWTRTPATRAARRGQEVPALDPQGRHDDHVVELHQRRIGRQDRARAGLERRHAAHPRRAQEAGRHHGRCCRTGTTERWADNWCILKNAKHPRRGARVDQQHPRPQGRGASRSSTTTTPSRSPRRWRCLPRRCATTRSSTSRPSSSNNYKFILNPSPAIVQARTKIYTEFKAG